MRKITDERKSLIKNFFKWRNGGDVTIVSFHICRRGTVDFFQKFSGWDLVGGNYPSEPEESDLRFEGLLITEMMFLEDEGIKSFCGIFDKYMREYLNGKIYGLTIRRGSLSLCLTQWGQSVEETIVRTVGKFDVPVPLKISGAGKGARETIHHIKKFLYDYEETLKEIKE